MSIRVIAFMIVIGVAILALLAWPKMKNPATAPGAEPQADAGGAGMPGAGPDASEPSLKWTVPARWTAQGERPMRLATYSAPAAKDDAEGGECAVFYFGPGQGGGIEANIDRWVGQFENPGAPSRSSQTLNGLAVARVKVRGTYLAPAGPAMESQGKKPDYTLLGAIVSGPRGDVFFKLTGPTKTIAAAAADFERMLGSIEKN